LAERRAPIIGSRRFGTRLVRDISPGSKRSGASFAPGFAALNSSAPRAVAKALWKSDGTSEGTLNLLEFYPCGDGGGGCAKESYPHDMRVVGHAPQARPGGGRRGERGGGGADPQALTPAGRQPSSCTTSPPGSDPRTPALSPHRDRASSSPSTTVWAASSYGR